MQRPSSGMEHHGPRVYPISSSLSSLLKLLAGTLHNASRPVRTAFLSLGFALEGGAIRRWAATEARARLDLTPHLNVLPCLPSEFRYIRDTYGQHVDHHTDIRRPVEGLSIPGVLVQHRDLDCQQWTIRDSGEYERSKRQFHIREYHCHTTVVWIMHCMLLTVGCLCS